MYNLSKTSVLFAIVLFLVNSVLGDSWQITTVDSISPWGTSIAIDSEDNAHISYEDRGNHDLKYAHWNGASWDITSVDTSGEVGSWSSIALDSDDHPHISYMNDDLKVLKYAYWNGSTWEITVPYNDPRNGSGTSIAIDGSDYPSISHNDELYGDLFYTYWSGTSWYTSVVDTSVTCAHSSLALETISANYPHIAYCDYTNKNLKYASFEETYWAITTLDSSGDTGYYPSIALDSNDYPHISYSSFYDGLKYAYFNGSSWNFTTVDPDGWLSSLVLDSNDHPHISYECIDGTYNGLKYAYFNGTSWELAWVDTTSSQAGDWNSIALDSNDNPHISYKDTYNGTLKYACYGPTGIEDEETSEVIAQLIGIYPNPSCGTVEINYAASAVSIVEFQVFDLSGRIVHSSSSEYEQGQHSLELNDLSSGVYLLKLKAGDLITSGRFVIID